MTETEAILRREEFTYPKTYFYIRSALYAVMLLSAAVIFKSLSEDVLSWFLLLATLLTGMLLLFGISPLLTRHWVTRNRLVLQRGWYFKAIVPIEDIEKVEIYDGEPRIGLSLSVRSSILFVTSSEHELIEIRLKKPKRYPQMLGLSAKRIVINVDQRGRIIEILRSRLTSLAPVETHGPDA